MDALGVLEVGFKQKWIYESHNTTRRTEEMVRPENGALWSVASTWAALFFFFFFYKVFFNKFFLYKLCADQGIDLFQKCSDEYRWCDKLQGLITYPNGKRSRSWPGTAPSTPTPTERNWNHHNSSCRSCIPASCTRQGAGPRPPPPVTLSLHTVQLISVPPQPWSGSCLSLSLLSPPLLRISNDQRPGSTHCRHAWFLPGLQRREGGNFGRCVFCRFPPPPPPPPAGTNARRSGPCCCGNAKPSGLVMLLMKKKPERQVPSPMVVAVTILTQPCQVVCDLKCGPLFSTWCPWAEASEGTEREKKPGGAGADGERSGGGRGMLSDGEDAARRGTVVNSRPTTAEASCSWCLLASSPLAPAQHTTQTFVTLHHHWTTASPPGPAQHTTQTLVTLHRQTTASPPWPAQRTTQTLVTLHHRQTTASPPGPAQHTTQTLVTCYHHHLHWGLHNIHPSHLSAQPTTWTPVTRHHQTTASPPELAQPTTWTPVTHHHQTTAPPPELAQPTTKTLITHHHHHQTTASPLKPAQEKPRSRDTSSSSSSPSYCISIGACTAYRSDTHHTSSHHQRHL